MQVQGKSSAEKRIFDTALTYLITPCPNGGIINDKGDVSAGLVANLQGAQELCVMKQDILHGASYMLEEHGILMTWASQVGLVC